MATECRTDLGEGAYSTKSGIMWKGSVVLYTQLNQLQFKYFYHIILIENYGRTCQLQNFPGVLNVHTFSISTSIFITKH